MSKTWKVINTFVLCIWAVLISFLLYKNYSGAELEKPKAFDEAFSKKTYWYDIYLKDKKIGFASTSFEKIGAEVIVKHEREMKAYKDGKENLFLESLKCLSDINHSIKSFEYVSHFKDEKGIKVTGEVDAGEILFFLESPEKRKTHKTAIKGDFYLSTTFLPVIIQKNPAPNTVFAVPLLNFSSLSIETVQVILEEIRPLKVGMNIFSIYKFRSGDTIWWCNDKGDMIKEKNTSGITLYSQAEVFTKDPADRVIFDYTGLPFMKSNMVLDDSEKINSLKVKIKNFRLNPQIYDNSPVTLTNDTLTIRKPTTEQMKGKTYQLPYTGSTLKKFIQPDDWVMSTYKPLQDTGRIYAKAYNSDAFLFSQYLTNYIVQLIRNSSAFVLSNSEQIMKSSLSGDYMERTVMFATYARAAGLPTRLVGGVVYLYGYFYFHTWPEIWLQEWIPVDPTLIQYPADATHIPLIEGNLNDITAIIEELNKINIEVLEAS